MLFPTKNQPLSELMFMSLSAQDMADMMVYVYLFVVMYVYLNIYYYVYMEIFNFH